MIALLQGLPLVALPNGQSVSFQKLWIKNALQGTASEQGYNCWSFELAESVELYLKREWSGSVITIAELEVIIKKLLLSLQLPDLAASFFLPSPPIKLSLLELAKEAGENYELLFFQLLKKRLEKVTQSSVEQLEIYGLDESLRYFFQHKRLGRQEVKNQIINYIRGCGASSSLITKRNPSRALEIKIV
jgi:hypothetical protein